MRKLMIRLEIAAQIAASLASTDEWRGEMLDFSERDAEVIAKTSLFLADALLDEARRSSNPEKHNTDRHVDSKYVSRQCDECGAYYRHEHDHKQDCSEYEPL